MLTYDKLSQDQPLHWWPMGTRSYVHKVPATQYTLWQSLMMQEHEHEHEQEDKAQLSDDNIMSSS